MGAGSSPTEQKPKARLDDLVLQAISSAFALCVLLTSSNPVAQHTIFILSTLSLFSWSYGHFVQRLDKNDCYLVFGGALFTAMLFQTHFVYLIAFGVHALFSLRKVALQGHSSEKEMLIYFKKQIMESFTAVDLE